MEESKAKRTRLCRYPFLREVYIRNSGFQGKDSAKSNSSDSAKVPLGNEPPMGKTPGQVQDLTPAI
jgi:hypothetical protein